MNENTGPYKGQKRFDVRYTIQEDLKKLGLFVDKKDNPMTVPLCEKSKDVIEPLLKPQWWMKMREMADEAIRVVKSGEIKIRPESAEKSYLRWMENINDWCLSRQLWWGHQAPMYLAHIYGEKPDESDGSFWFAGRTQEEAEIKARKALPGKNFTLRRDEDVLDTWFSSGLWPFATLGWPKKTHDFETLFPTSVLETGWDILFFWVARMIMFGIKMTGKVPFTEVYCHSLIRDSDGRKMSKSLGNVIDPQDVIQGIALEELHKKLLSGNLNPLEVEKAKKYQKTAFPDGIPQCGTDALRFALVSYTTGGGDIAFDIKVIYGYRKFCNKIYQATKYVVGKLDEDFVPSRTGGITGKESLAERWILHKMTTAAKEVNQALEDREFMRSTMVIYQYWYNHLCDVYIENSKAIIQDGTEEEKRSATDTLYTALEGALTMIHPYMPFLTEELWQRLPRRPDDKTPSIVLAKYPVYDPKMDDPASEAAYELVLGISRGIRSLMAEYSLKDEGKVFVQTYDTTSHSTVTSQLQSIRSLSGKGVSTLDVLSSDDSRPAGCVVFSVSSSAAVYLHVKGRVDIDGEIQKATRKLEKTRAGVEKQRKILDDPGYREKASQELQDAEKKKLGDLETEQRSRGKATRTCAKIERKLRTLRHELAATVAENMSEESAQPAGPETNGFNGKVEQDSAGKQPDKQPEDEKKGTAAVAKDKLTATQKKVFDKNNPPGGYDATPIPSARDGYTVRFTFHRAENLPVSDLNSRSSDPFIRVTLTSALPKRHKEDPDMVLRTPTIHKSTNPEWNTQWTVAGIPSSGFRLKCRLYDEDSSDHDDRLGNVTIHVDRIGANWNGIREESFSIKKRMGSKRAYMIRGCASLLDSNVHMNGVLYVSAEVLGESEEPHGRMYTVGTTSWIKHYSPMIGRLAGTKAPDSTEHGGDGKTEKYDFQANQFQLQGPVPAELYHRFVEFKPFVNGMFSRTGIRGRVLNSALHHQHARVYNFSNTTEYGIVRPRSEEAALQFLKMVHYDEGGRIFTYVLTLDGLLRFTETGKEFGIDLLSKHTMHSDVNIYIASSGEFFIRRLRHPNESSSAPDQETHPSKEIPGGPPHEPPPKNPKHYQLIIDNDSGTYRPKGDLLPKLKEFLKANFPGLHIMTRECTDEKLAKMKDEQRERKKKEGRSVTVVQNSDGDISSSDEEALTKAGQMKKTKKTRAYEALEDPSQALKDLIPREKGENDREEREIQSNTANNNASGS
ncbi:hypothetical protein B7494_g5902 [Chlorociboria aeruginascens]|nr:hypothetical protein B7494_g5902 [Chlorociboria aeruginascens]